MHIRTSGVLLFGVRQLRVQRHDLLAVSLLGPGDYGVGSSIHDTDRQGTRRERWTPAAERHATGPAARQHLALLELRVEGCLQAVEELLA